VVECSILRLKAFCGQPFAGPVSSQSNYQPGFRDGWRKTEDVIQNGEVPPDLFQKKHISIEPWAAQTRRSGKEFPDARLHATPH
jgi:hypothetical protein